MHYDKQSLCLKSPLNKLLVCLVTEDFLLINDSRLLSSPPHPFTEADPFNEAHLQSFYVIRQEQPMIVSPACFPDPVVSSLTLSSLARMMLDAGAEVVNLHNWGPHYYETGRHLVRLRHGEGPAMATSLVEVGR